MAAQLDLPAALARRGLTVELVPGWQTRSAGSFAPGGAVSHWTAGPRTGDRPSLSICTYGRAGLPGPLCNVFLTRAGVAVVVSANRANHAGSGSWRGMVGNSAMFATEAESAGDGNWTAEQKWAYPRVNAAYLDLIGTRDVNRLCGHHEWAPTRKIDIRDWPMSAMRQQVAAVLAGTDIKIEEPDVQLTDTINLGTKDKSNNVTVAQILGRTYTAALTTAAKVAALETALAGDSGNPVTQAQLDEAVAKGLAALDLTLTIDAGGTT